ncbi:DUF488 domain-containing protein [Histidinibacterium aquaticum]|uniref:DUF488 domain-containing protein n=1 Tax=Histidinibacterium aquaticum TaxID=2613962 RepID=A0A5J5GRN7_9RHOB|nr:DUF488 domain-containing protein [Histidinibacterium aquaticum]KAA9010042.1 DUF488 domain-containing protein [Histidinibacterium aquaticum]
MRQGNSIFTVGHSTHSMDKFLQLLKAHQVTAIADVRSSPYSRHVPHFSRETLSEALAENGVAYVFLGRELGARSRDNSCYVNDVVSYDRLSNTSEFQSGIHRLLDGRKSYRISLMCSEKDPTECHRTILVAKRLVEIAVPVVHILGDGSVEPHEDTMLRVADILGMPRNDLLRSERDVIADAYKFREKQIAYRRRG